MGGCWSLDRRVITGREAYILARRKMINVLREKHDFTGDCMYQSSIITRSEKFGKPWSGKS